jgi:hypothetical protein
MAVFLERPWPASGIGVFLKAVLALLLWRSGWGVLLVAMVLGGVLLDWE